MTRDQIQAVLHQEYARHPWLQVLREILPGTDVFATPQAVSVSVSDAPPAVQLARVRLADRKQLAVLEVEVSDRIDLLRNRVGLRNLVARFIDQQRAHGVLAIFRSPGKDYRFTFVAKESTLAQDGSLTTKETATRRFTYVLGPNEPCRTATQRFASLAAKGETATLEDVTEAFSVEKLNREFFDTYKAHYQKFCAYLLDGDAPTRVFRLKLKGFDEKGRDHALKPVRDFVKKMLGRLVFLHFLQKKGWLGCPANAARWRNGDPNFLKSLFDTASAADQQRFHSRRLVPLFFDTLNRKRKGDIFAITGTRVPYLNGGLFERDFENVEQIDFPAELFRDLLEFFGQYNFTIDENDPDDHEIGIDPEMLGHIFENLLEDNKDKGAFYTPKAIVQYMCQQSLIYYLKQHLGDRPEIETLVRRKDVGDPHDKDNWIRQNAKQIEKLLDEVKICDPAIGSGAFPIGLLQEIYWIKLSLDWTLDRARAKRDIIQHSIYGVDIDAGAVEIARLRFWLALVVEENTPRPLPNLDYKIMQGNSLLESFEGIDLSNLTGKKRQTVQLLGAEQTELGLKAVSTELTVEFAEGKQGEIGKLINAYFDQDDHEQKQELHKKIDELVLGHIEYNLDLHEERVQAVLDNARKELKRKQVAARGYQPTKREAARMAELEAQLAEVDRKRDELAKLQEKPERPFFLWHLFVQDVFAKGGFDIVIANPPYGAEIPEADAVVLRTQFQTLANSLDSFIVFMEQSSHLLHSGGTLSFIIPCGWVSTPSCRKLRSFFAKSFKPHAFASLPYDVFGEAYVDTMIVVATRLATGEGWETIADKAVDLVVFPVRHRIAELADFDRFRKASDFGWWGDPSEDGFLVTSSLAEAKLVSKLRRMPKQFDDVVEVMRGIETYNPKPVPSPRNSRRALVGDIYRYEINHTGNGFISYSPEIESGKPWRFFSGPRILLRQLLSRKFRLQAGYAEDDFLTNQSVQSLLARNEASVPIKVLLAVLNSKLISWFFCQINMVARRDDFPKTIIKVTRELPIPDVGQPRFESQRTSLIALVDRMLAAKQVGDSNAIEQLETEIDNQVFRIYGLTPEEIELVQSASVATIRSDAKSDLFDRVLPELKAASFYFTTDTIAGRVRELGLEIKPGTLPVYLSEATAARLIHDAGRGWYSRLSEPVPLDAKPVAKLIRAVEKAFPLLDFTVWSTAQINPWMHHLLAQPVTFLHAPADTLESVGDALREQGWDVAVNPTPSSGPKSVRPGEKMVVLRPALSKQPPGDGRQATIEKVLVDLIAEAPRLALMDASEAQRAATAIISQFLVQIAVLQRYADSRAIKLEAIESVNQRQSSASIGDN